LREEGGGGDQGRPMIQRRTWIPPRKKKLKEKVSEGSLLVSLFKFGEPQGMGAEELK